MREIVAHKGELDEQGELVVKPGAGGNVLYRIHAHPHGLAGERRFDAPDRYAITRRANGQWEDNFTKIKFQTGAYKEQMANGDWRELLPNGITDECLLAILVDRFEQRQNPPAGYPKVPCPQHAGIINRLRECLTLLQERIQDRETRGVEATRNV